MDVDDDEALDAGQMFLNIPLEQAGPFLETGPAKEESSSIGVLTSSDDLPQRPHAVPQDEPAGPRIEQLPRGWARSRIEERVETLVAHWRPFIHVARPQEVPVEIDVVLVDPPQPHHPVGVQVHAQGSWRSPSVSRECRRPAHWSWIAEPANASTPWTPDEWMIARFGWSCSEPGDVDREILAAGALGRQL